MKYAESTKESEKLIPKELKNVNRQRVYSYLYQAKECSKQEIAQALGLSIPTVSQSLNTFMKQDFVRIHGEYESTGGRKAQIFGFNYLARIAIGVEVLKEGVQILAVDLYGSILKEDFWQIKFENCDTYYCRLGKMINQFTDSLQYPASQNLGICIAIQGLVSSDGETITFSEILNSTGVKQSTYQQYLDLPCKLVHDTEAAALAESWHRPDIKNAIYLSLNRNFGGILILNGQVFSGHNLSSGIIEHLCLDPNGPLCYCGKQGCAETYCSANSLKNAAQMELPLFFTRVHKGDPRCCKIWRNYLHNLALIIDNIRMIIDCDFILGGFLLQYMNDNDIAKLTRYIKEQCAFASQNFSLKLSQHGNKSTPLGAAIILIEQFFNQLNWQ